MMNEHRVSRNLVVGLSGPSSSGKTTLARLLRSVFNISASPETNQNSVTLSILHEDDFYKTDAEIPTITTPDTRRQLQDWDCALALNLCLLEGTLQHIHHRGCLPPQMRSKEDQNCSGDSGVPNSAIDQHRRVIITSSLRQNSHHHRCRHQNSPTKAGEPGPSGTDLRIWILEGFLLYPDPTLDLDPEPQGTHTLTSATSETCDATPSPRPPSPHISSITALLDLKLFLRSTYSLTRCRRQARPGYVTLEGFWEDPPGYVDEVVWPNYVREHGWMFEEGDVDRGEVREVVREGAGVHVGPGKGEKQMQELLGWAVGVLGTRVEREIAEAEAEAEAEEAKVEKERGRQGAGGIDNISTP